MDSENFDIDTASELEIEEYITNLTIEKDNLASEGYYLEAAKIRKKLEEIKNQLSNQKKNSLNDQHESELQMLEESYVTEIFTFNQEWDSKLNYFNESAKDLEQEINDRHQEDLEIFIQKEEEKLSKIVKFSPDYLNIKKMETQLVKAEKYEEAYLLKNQRNKLEKIETDKFEKDNAEKLKSKCDALTHKQNLERNALRQKLDLEFEVMKKRKETDLAKIILKYKNKRKDLNWLHKSQVYQNEQMLSKAKNAKTVNNMNNSFNNSFSSTKLKYPTENNNSGDGNRSIIRTNSILKYSTENRKMAKGSATKKGLKQQTKIFGNSGNLNTRDDEENEQGYEDEVQVYQTENQVYQTEDQVNQKDNEDAHQVSQQDSKEKKVNLDDGDVVEKLRQTEIVDEPTLEENVEVVRQTQAKEESSSKDSGREMSTLELLRKYSLDTSKKSAVDLHRQYSNYPQENENDLEYEQEVGREVIVETYEDKEEH